MKTKKALLSFILAAVLITASILPALAADGPYSYSAEAQKLNTLGLFVGTSSTTFVPDLGASSDRQAATVMLLRLFGLSAVADGMPAASVSAALAQFSDAGDIAGWARNSVAYAVKNGLVNGLPVGTFGPTVKVNGNMYATMILRQLGFTPDYGTATSQLADRGGLTPDQAKTFSAKDLIRDDLCGISFGTLSAKDKDGKRVIDNLIMLGNVRPDAAKDCGLLDGNTYAAMAAVELYLNAPLTTLSEVSTAEGLGTTAAQLVAKVADPTSKATLEAALTEQNTKVAVARAALTPLPPPAPPQGQNDQQGHQQGQ